MDERLTILTAVFKYPNGLHETFQNVTFYQLWYRAKKHQGVRPIRVYVQSNEYSIEDMEFKHFIYRAFWCCLHPTKREGFWLNGKKVF